MSPDNPYARLPAGAGPDGGTLLGFLASVGVLVAFTRRYTDRRVTLHWEQSLGWRGRILIGGQSLVSSDIQALHSSLTEPNVRDLFTLWKGTDDGSYATITKIEVNDAARFLAAALRVEQNARRRSCATLAGWFMDQPDEKPASASRLCALTGGSQQNFLETFVRLPSETKGQNGAGYHRRAPALHFA